MRGEKVLKEMLRWKNYGQNLRKCKTSKFQKKGESTNDQKDVTDNVTLFIIV